MSGEFTISPEASEPNLLRLLALRFGVQIASAALDAQYLKHFASEVTIPSRIHNYHVADGRNLYVRVAGWWVYLFRAVDSHGGHGGLLFVGKATL
jgi:hypothetical protein